MEDTTIRKTISIDAPAGKVWEVLLEPEFTRQWGGEFMEGCYVESDWSPGSAVIWKDGEGTPFVVGVVEELEPESLLAVKFYDDVSSRPPDTPGDFAETYTLSENGDGTALSIINEMGHVDRETVSNASKLWDKALRKIKELSES